MSLSFIAGLLVGNAIYDITHRKSYSPREPSYTPYYPPSGGGGGVSSDKYEDACSGLTGDECPYLQYYCSRGKEAWDQQIRESRLARQQMDDIWRGRFMDLIYKVGPEEAMKDIVKDDNILMDSCRKEIEKYLQHVQKKSDIITGIICTVSGLILAYGLRKTYKSLQQKKEK